MLLVFFTNLCESRALHKFHSSQFLCQFFACLKRDGLLSVFGELFQRCWVVTQIYLCPNKQEGRLLTVMCDLWHPLQQNIHFTVNIIVCHVLHIATKIIAQNIYILGHGVETLLLDLMKTAYEHCY